MTPAAPDRRRWQRQPHPYVCRYPAYLCQRCDLWPGHPVHSVDEQGASVTCELPEQLPA